MPAGQLNPAIARRFDVPAATLKGSVNPRPARPRPPMPPDQAQARRLYRRGATIGELAERYAQPWIGATNRWRIRPE